MRKRLVPTLLSALALAAGGLAACNRGGPADAPVQVGAGGEVLRAPEPKEQSQTLRQVRARGRVNCGVAGDAPGFSYRDADDAWRGFDVDFCRAVAAAVLGNPNAVNFTALDARTRFAALQSGVVDLVARNTAWTYSRDVAQGVDFVGVSYYDSQAFMAARSLDVRGGLGGRRVCVAAGSTDQLTLADWFKARTLEYTPVPADTGAAALQAYLAGACDLLTGDRSELAADIAAQARPDDYLILPETVSKEPFGPMVREGDPAWLDIVQWTLFGLILADEFGLTAQNVEAARQDNPDPEVRRLLGAEGAYGPLLGLRKDWAFLMIQKVGGYGEIFERNLGTGSTLKLPRGLNAAWNAQPPGLLYAPPMR